MNPEDIADRGVIRTFQIVRPMRGMTVLENAMIGAFCRTANVNEASDIATVVACALRPASRRRTCPQRA